MTKEEEILEKAREYGYQALFYTPKDDEDLDNWLKIRRPGARTSGEYLIIAYAMLNYFVMKAARLEIGGK